MYNKSCKKQVTFNKCNILYYVCCVSCMIIIIVASCLPSYTFGVINTTCTGCMMLSMVHGSLISILCIIIESRCYIYALADGTCQHMHVLSHKRLIMHQSTVVWHHKSRALILYYDIFTLITL